MKVLNKSNERGFSLVELMIVVGIIGVLATLAVPKFQAFQAKARSAEAKTMLNHIYTLEEAYKLDNNSYLDFASYGRQAAGALNCTVPTNAQNIGFEIKPCGGPVPRYGYSVNGATNSAFISRAASGATANNLVCPGSAAHSFNINQDKQIWVEAGNSSTAANAENGTGGFAALCN